MACVSKNCNTIGNKNVEINVVMANFFPMNNNPTKNKHTFKHPTLNETGI